MTTHETTLLAIHPVATADPATIAWVIPPGTLDTVGEVDPVPTVLAELGVRRAVVTPTGVELTLPDPALWRTQAGAIRTALLATLADPGVWRAAQVVLEADRITAAVEQALAGPAGEIIRSHGGDARLIDVRDRVAVIEFSGSCRHCPALNATLHGQLARAVEQRCPDLAGLRLESRT
ncbi:MAG: NifU family protein, partial [Propionibacteriaceae bacterium]|nr:NifU family protein [Propionibacteriaceae bacterium]